MEIVPIDKEAERINRIHHTIAYGANLLFIAAAKCGGLLVAKKQEVGHGRWQRWCRTYLEFSMDTVQRYMWVNLHRHEIEEKLGKDARLTEAYSLRKDSTIKRGTILADRKRMERDLVKPIEVVRRRLRKLPWSPVYEEDLKEVLAMALDRAKSLVLELSCEDSDSVRDIMEDFRKNFPMVES